MIKKTYYILLVFLCFSCTSNTILEKPKDLIPKDSMSLLLQELFIASSSKFIKNVHLKKNINYMPFVYDRFKIDSVRFQNSNVYYMSRIDDYQSILENATKSLELQKKEIEKIKKTKETKRRDSLKKLKPKLDKLKINKDSLVKKRLPKK